MDHDDKKTYAGIWLLKQMDLAPEDGGRTFPVVLPSELAPLDEVLQDPRHPYTKELLRSVPRAGMALPRRAALTAEILPGCRFRNRCPMRFEPCDEEPDLLEVEGRGRMARCWLVDEASVEGANELGE